MEAKQNQTFTSALLTDDQVFAFYNDGFFLLPEVFSPAEVSQMASAFDRLQTTAQTLGHSQIHQGAYFVVEGNKIDRIVWCGAAEPYLLDVGSDPRLTGPASQLLDSKEMDQLICQAHFKLPADGVEFKWHQDSEHRRHGTDLWKDINGRGSYVQTLLNIDPMHSKNGPLLVVPGSARWGHLALDKERKDYSSLAVSLTMEPGSVLFLHPYTIHGSFPNSSNTPRRVFINGYSYPGANSRIYPGEGSGRRVNVAQYT